MFKIDYDNKITMVLGDTGVIRMRIRNYVLSQGDEVRFAIVNKANPSILLCQHSDKKIVLEKQVTKFEKDGSARIIIYPDDTENLQPGKYLYEIQVKTKDGRVDTVVPLASFRLMDGSIQGEFGQTTPSEIELRFERIENEIIPELGNRITNVEKEIDSVSSSLDNIMNVNVATFGAIPNGIDDNSIAFQNAFNYAKEKGITRVLIPEGKYNFNKTVNVPNGLTIEGIGNVELFSSLNEYVGVNVERHRCIFYFGAEYEEDNYTGTSGEYLMKLPIAINEVGNDNLNTNTLTIPSSYTTVDGRVLKQSMPPLKVGDEIRVVSYNNWMGRSLQGEFHKITNINGSTITLEKPLKYKTDISIDSPWRKLYQTEPDSLGFYTDNGVRPNVLNYPYQGFYKIKPCTNKLKNLKFKDGSRKGWSCLFLGAKDSIIDNCEFDISLWFMDCQDMVIKNSKLNNVKHWLGNGGSGLEVYNCIFNNGILTLEEGCNDYKVHSNTFVKNTSSSYDSPILAYSKSRNGVIENNVIYSTANMGIDIVNSAGNHSIRYNKINTTNTAVFMQTSTSKIDLECYINDNIIDWTRNFCFAVKSNGQGVLNGGLTDNILLGDSKNSFLKEGSTEVNITVENKDKNGKIVTALKTVNPPSKGSYFKGDIVIIDGVYFKCTNGGNFNRNVTGLTITVSNLSPIATVNDTSKLKIGDIVNANGIPGIYKIINIYDNKIELFPTPRANVTNGSLFLTGTPKFEII